MFSSVLALMPPVMILARQSNRSTICISAPCAIRSSIALIWPVISYDASKSIGAGQLLMHIACGKYLLCCISRDLLKMSVRV